MAESTLSLTYNDLAAIVGVYFSFGATVGSFSAADAEQVAVAIRSGYRRFLFPPNLPNETVAHKWSFLHPGATLAVNAPQSSSTVTIVDGVVTLAAGTFPSWAAQGLLSISGTMYEVSTRDSNTQLTLFDTTLDADAGTSYVLYQADVDAPDNFGGFDDPPTFITPSSRNERLTIVDESAIRAVRGTSGQSTGRPMLIAERVINATATTGQRWQFMVWPAPDEAHVFSYTYHVLPDMFTTTQYPLGGMAHAETIKESCLAAAAEMLRDQEGYKRKNEEFMTRLAASIAHDRQRMMPDRIITEREMSETSFNGRRPYPRALTHSYESGV